MRILAKNILIILFALGLFCPNATAISELDSLYQLLTIAKEDTVKVNTLLDICWQLHRTDLKTTKELALSSLKLAEKLDYQRGIGESYSYLSWIYFSNGENETALKYSTKAAIIGEKLKDPVLSGIAYNDIAIIYSETGRADEALAIWQKCIDLDIEAGLTTGIPITYLNMAELLTGNNNKEEARKYLFKALETSEGSENSMIVSAVLLAIAEMYEGENDIEKARQNYLKALEISNKDGDLEISAFANLGLSSLNAMQGHKELALEQAVSAIDLVKTIGDAHSSVLAYSKFAKIQRTLKEYEQSLNSSFKVLQISQEFNLTTGRIDAYKEISKTYSETQDYEQAYLFSEKHHTLKDSTFSEEKSDNILKLEKKYHSELKEQENTVLKLQQKEQELQIQQNSTLNKSLFSILFLLCTVGILAYYQYSDKISAHKILEEKVEGRTEELRLMNNILEKSNKELESFAYIASHDLREPLRNISGFAGMLKRELKPEVDSNIYEYLSFITDNTSQLSKLIQDILTYSKLNQQSETLILANPNIIINDISKTLAHSIKQKKVKIFVKGNLPILKSSGQQVYFLFKNLIENGIKYNESAFPRIDIVSNDIGDKYEFLVKDNGIGINPEYSAKVFEMFTRLHDRKQSKGTGLGLSLCRKIVENHGGTIRVQATENKGSSFIFTWDKNFTESISDEPKASKKNLVSA